MPALVKTRYNATITWLGFVADRSASLRADPLQQATAHFTGLETEAHGGLTRPSCVRFAMLHPKGTEIRNTRQLSMIASEDLDGIAKDLGLDTLDPALIGASLVVSGIPDFSHIPPGSRLQTSAGTTLTVDLENGPCRFPGDEIEVDHPGHGSGFEGAAANRRGLTAWVERPGPLAVGDSLSLFVPTQPAWAPGV